MQLGDNDIVIYVGGNITDFQQKMAQAKGITATTSASKAATFNRAIACKRYNAKNGNTWLVLLVLLRLVLFILLHALHLLFLIQVRSLIYSHRKLYQSLT